MRAFVIFLCLAVAICHADNFTDKMMEKMLPIVKECQGSTKATDEDLAVLAEKKVPASKEGKCMLACIHKKFGVQKEDGTIDKSKSMEMLEPLKEHSEDLYNKVKTIMEGCASEVANDADECVTAANLMECGVKKAKDMKLDVELI